MKEFQNQKMAIHRLSKPTRFVYSAFLTFSLISYVVMIVIATQRAGWFPGGVSDYFLGNEARDTYPKTTGELLEVSHFHLFTIPLMLLVQGHIFVMSSFSKKWIHWVVTASFISGAFYITGPWLVIYIGPSTAIIGIFGRFILIVTLFIMTIYPLKDMWRFKE